MPTPPPTPPERWLPVPNLANWEASSHGNVRHGATPAIPYPDTVRGYPTVSISLTDAVGPPFSKRTCRFVRVHELVLLAFLGPRPRGLIPCFIDGDPMNIHLDNLTWARRGRVLRYAAARRRRMTRLDLDSAVEVLTLAEAGLNPEQISRSIMMGGELLKPATVRAFLASSGHYIIRRNGEPFNL